MKIMQEDLYSENEMKFDLEYVAKKLDWSVVEFKAIIDQPPVRHKSFPTNDLLFNYGRKLKKILQVF
jgi:hypothetical protein